MVWIVDAANIVSAAVLSPAPLLVVLLNGPYQFMARFFLSSALFFTRVMKVDSPSFPGAMLLDSTIVTLPFSFAAVMSGYQSVRRRVARADR